MDILTAILAITVLAAAFGLLLGFGAIRFKVEGDPVADRIDSMLPQTQCGQCEFSGCRPYAEAVAAGEAAINRCVPGGESTMLALADLLDTDPLPLGEDAAEPVKTVAIIDEETCIGCTKCIQACPVDAILGAAKHMHTVIGSECTGCELCLPPCPVDCIDMVPISVTPATWQWPHPEFVQPDTQKAA
ncbi:MAG: electron transport complex subunit RsxB [Gammaproteobacteria bacterium]|nr:electron transport complex subunit RsxB [Gammaproteobacteria bacterium]MCP5137211.1 electron transport complex subunit RsxB [Gammaproteobacteria bacterium]